MRKSKRPLLNRLQGLIILFVAITAIHNTAMAELELTGVYTGFQFSDSNQEFTPDVGASIEEGRGHIKGKLGTYLTDFMSVEGQLGFTNNSDNDLVTLGVYLRLDHDFGGYKVYGLLGVSGIADEDEETESGGSYGVGLEIFGSKNVAITVEYLTLIDKEVDGGDFSLNTLGLGFTYYFSDESSVFNKNRNKIRSIRY